MALGRANKSWFELVDLPRSGTAWCSACWFRSIVVHSFASSINWFHKEIHFIPLSSTALIHYFSLKKQKKIGWCCCLLLLCGALAGSPPITPQRERQPNQSILLQLFSLLFFFIWFMNQIKEKKKKTMELPSLRENVFIPKKFHFFFIQYILLGSQWPQHSSIQSFFSFSKRRMKWIEWIADGRLQRNQTVPFLQQLIPIFTNFHQLLKYFHCLIPLITVIISIEFHLTNQPFHYWLMK